MVRFFLSVAFVLGAFGYGIGVGRYQWPPWHAMAAGFRAIYPPQPSVTQQSYLEARAELFARSKAHPDVVMLGDSLTEMGIWAELLEGFSVINRGISGDDSSGVLERLPEVLHRRPRVICLEIGINDLQRGIRPDRVVENIRTVAAATTQAGIVIILQSVPFVTDSPRINEEVRTLNAGLRQLTNGVQVRFFDLNTILADGDAPDPRNSYDGLHLNARGYLIWTTALAPEVRNALQ